MSFANPILLCTLLAAPLLVLLTALARRRASRFALRFPALDVLSRIARHERSWRRLVPLVAAVVALAAVGVALARPHVSLVVPTERATVVLVLDTSRSMQSGDVAPSRLEAAKRAAATFIDRVPDRLRLGLVTFAGDVTVAASPTRDRELVRTAVQAVDPFTSFGGGTAIGDAIARAVEVGERAVAHEDGSPATPEEVSQLVSILFLSDGRQNRGVLPPFEGAARARRAGIRVFTVALGTPDASAPSGGGSFGGGFGFSRAPDLATLRAIARQTGGEFTAARTAGELQDAYGSLGSRLGRAPEVTEVTVAFVALAAAALLAGVLSSAWWAPRLP